MEDKEGGRKDSMKGSGIKERINLGRELLGYMEVKEERIR